MNFFSSWSIRRKLLFLTLVTVVPALGIILYSGLERRENEILLTKRDTLHLVQSLAAQQEQLAASTRQMLKMLAQLQEVQRIDARACSRIFRDIQEQNPVYAIINAVMPDGNMFAASQPFTPGSVNLADRKHIRDAIRMRDFSAGEYIVGRVVKVPTIVYSYPVLDKKGKLIAVVTAGIKLDKYKEFMARLNLPEGSVVSIADHKNITLYRLPEREDIPPGTPLPRQNVQRIPVESEEGFYEGTGRDNVSRIYAYKRLWLHPNEPPYLVIYVGLDRNVALRRANTSLVFSLILLGIASLFAMMLAWIAGNTLIVVPLNKLVNLARRLGEGDMSVRMGLRQSRTELGRLAESFDTMASMLEARGLGRRKAEVALKESEKRYRQLVDNINKGIFVAQDGMLKFINPMFITIMGRSEHDLTRLPFTEFIHPHDRNMVLERHISRIKGENPPSRYELRVVTSDGNIRWVELDSVMIEWEDRPAAMGFLDNITERKDAEEAVRRSEMLFRTIFDKASSGIAVIDSNSGRFLRVNQRYCEMVGYSSEEMLQMDFLRVTHPDDLQHDLDNMARLREGQIDQFTMDKRYVVKDGTIVWGTLTVAPLWDKGEYPKAHLAIVMDITDSKKAEELNMVRLALFEFSATHTLNEILQKTLDQVGELTESPVGFYHFVGSDQETLTLQAWSTRTMKEFCKVEGKGFHYPIADAGVWVDCVREGRPVVHNDYSALPHRKGLPEGHAQVHRELVVPIMRSGKIMAILGVGNKPTGYTDEDIETVSYLADIAWDIAARKLAEEALKESEERYRIAIEGSIDGIILVQNGLHTYANQAFLDMFGYATLDEIAGTSRYLTIHPDDHKRVTEYTEARLKGEYAPTRYEFGGVRKDGTPIDIEVSATTISYEGASAILAYVRDITEEKWAKEKERARERKYRIVADNTYDWEYWLDPEYRFIYSSPSCERITGYNAEEFLANPDLLDQIIHPDHRDDFVRHKKQVYQTGQTGEIEFPVIRSDGTKRWIGHVSQAVYDENGVFVGMRASDRDITDRKRAEEALRESEARLRLSAQSANLGLWDWDLETNRVYFSPEWKSQIGYRDDEISNHFDEWQSRVHPGDLEPVLKKVHAFIENPQGTHEVEFRFRHKKGTYLWICALADVLRDADKKPVRMLGYHLDITPRKLAEEALKASLTEKEVMLKEIHHRVKNNLQLISSLLHIQSRQVKDPKALDAFRESMNRVKSMAVIHDKLYRSSSLAWIEFSEYVKGFVTGLVQETCYRKMIHVRYDIEPVSFVIDTAVPCGLLVNELVSNSLKHAFPGDRTGEISISLHREGECLSLSVSDDGIGFPEHLDHTATDTMGLRLVSMLTEQLRGGLTLSRNGGTTFTVAFKDTE